MAQSTSLTSAPSPLLSLTLSSPLYQVDVRLFKKLTGERGGAKKDDRKIALPLSNKSLC
jgi:hypothetical protein